MLCADIIDNFISPLKPNDTVAHALSVMEEYKVEHLPLVDKKAYLGMISEEELLCVEDTETEVSVYQKELIRPAIRDNQHIFAAFDLFDKFQLTLLPVVDDQEQYAGYLSMMDMIEASANLGAVREQGSILVLEMGVHDYSLAELARLVEGNDAKVLSAYITSPLDSTKIEVTLKINRPDLSAIIQTFERYEYIVKASFHHSNSENDLRRKFDSFMHYLNM